MVFAQIYGKHLLTVLYELGQNVEECCCFLRERSWITLFVALVSSFSYGTGSKFLYS